MLQVNDQQIFLIDEDEIVRDSMKILLESHGNHVQDFRSTAVFMENIEDVRGGCLVVSCNRAIAGGVDLVETLHRRGINLPAIFVVGGGNATTRALAQAAGAFAYLERPIEEAALIRSVRSALSRSASERPPAAAPIAVRS